MTFGENLQFLRKQRNMTQEALAEQMNVSRQSVSKWESNATYPEMDAILRLCDLFHCDMDTLLRGNVSLRYGEDAAAYDRHMNRFAAAIAAGVGLILLGIVLLVFAVGQGIDEWGVILFFILLIPAVVLFITSGMNHVVFLRQHPDFTPCYTQEEMNRFQRLFPLLIAVSVALILLGVLVVVAAAFLTSRIWEQYAMLLLCIAIAASVLTWAGIQYSKYGFPEPEQTPAERRVGRIWGSVMVASTAVYVGLGLTINHMWDRAWVIYPVAAMLCVAVTILIKKDDEP